MPILDVTIVGELARDDSARRLADAAGELLGAAPGETFVRIHRLEARDFAQSGHAAPSRVVLAHLLAHELGAPRSRDIAALTAVVADVLGCARAEVHLVLEPPGASRVALGGELAPGPARHRVSSGAKWEAIVGYCRAMRVGDLVWVTGTTAVRPDGSALREGDGYAQARLCFENIVRALEAHGGSARDVVRTRMYVTDIARDWEAIGRAHAECFGDVRPATTMVEVRALIEPWMRVEIEADAYLGR